MTNDATTPSQAVASQARHWVLRLSSGEMDEAEMDSLKAWLAQNEEHVRAFEQNRLLWLQLGDQPDLFRANTFVPPPRRHCRSWARLTSPRRVGIGISAIAASLLILLLVPQASLWLRADHLTSSTIARYELPDGSLAWLDAGSAISVNYDDRERRVTLLRGNAFFTVRHGERRPFKVAALDGEVQDIGTSFEVRRSDAQVDVAVTQGAVRVSPARDGRSGVMLREGEGLAYGSSGRLLSRSEPHPASVATWRRAELMIDRQPIAKVIREIARYRKGQTWIWADLPETLMVNGAYRVDDADRALDDLAAVQGLTITWAPGNIAIIRAIRPSH
ncbi:FecR family protein [Sphingobium sp. B12D2B]|uniref:FecR family protein n=1 Tax=Sphingobium sp. B12D2B TaxID=2940577 RepID=UPI002225A1FE|nr:FecR domain-containing protein [Sphingobium sp. B12D2B]MCW2349153.1 transmembrane sensor [Sphingobium sp. B12D2B]